jgi:hypothetical protein
LELNRLNERRASNPKRPGWQEAFIDAVTEPLTKARTDPPFTTQKEESAYEQVESAWVFGQQLPGEPDKLLDG